MRPFINGSKETLGPDNGGDHVSSVGSNGLILDFLLHQLACEVNQPDSGGFGGPSGQTEHR